MEDPTRFDLWAQLIKGDLKQIENYFTKHFTKLSKLEIHKQINYSITTGNRILIASSLNWTEAQHMIADPPCWITNTQIIQEGSNPYDGSYKYCAIHNFYYGGCLGCSVCRGFYCQ